MENDVSLWDADTGKLRYEPIRHDDKGHGVELSADGRLMALASYDGSVRIRELSSGAVVAQLPTHPDDVYSARFSPDEKLLVTACRDGSVRVWDWKLGQLVSPPCEHARDAVDAVFNSTGQWIMSVSAAEHGVRVWDWRSGKPVTPALNIPHAISVAITPDSKHAVVGGFTGSICFLHLNDLTIGPVSSDLDQQLNSLCNGTELLSGQRLHSGGGTVNLSAEEWLQRWRQSEKRPKLDE